MSESIHSKYQPIYDKCKSRGTLPWDNFDTFCEVLDAVERAGHKIYKVIGHPGARGIEHHVQVRKGE